MRKAARAGALYAATHSGLFRLPDDGGESTRVANRYQDTMGFTVVGPSTDGGATFTTRYAERASAAAAGGQEPGLGVVARAAVPRAVPCAGRGRPGVAGGRGLPALNCHSAMRLDEQDRVVSERIGNEAG